MFSMLIFETYKYNFLLLLDKVNLLLFNFGRASEGFVFGVLETVRGFLVKCNAMH